MPRMTDMTNTNQLNLKPCPFCGSENIDPKGWMTSGGVAGPACDDCGASAGCATQTTEENVQAWNRRSD